MIHTGLADYLAQAPDRQKGVHIDDLQKALDLDGRKLTIVLRYLSTQGWVRETEESVFALNRPGFEILPGTNGLKRLRYASQVCKRKYRYLTYHLARPMFLR